jgi:hypothetical protein
MRARGLLALSTRPRFCHLAGSINAATETVESEAFEQSASLWWPDDHAWCVATEIDFNTTYIGCDEACCDEICRLPDLEVFVVDPAARDYETW